MNSYDAPAAIKIRNSFVYVTGEVFDSVTQANYATVQLRVDSGFLNWKRQYDYHGLYDIAFAMDIKPSGDVVLAGASQDSLTIWQYCSLEYDSTGAKLDTTRITGTGNSFDRPKAVKCDKNGNFYITGAGTDSSGSFNAKTVKIDSVGNFSWMSNFGTSGNDDEGNDLIVDDSGYVYVCGKTWTGNTNVMNYLLIKYNQSGTKLWHMSFDADSSDDEALKMCFDNYGNIIMTGAATRNGKTDILTIAYSRTGSQIWKTHFNGEFDGDDRGTDILSDENGNIYVTGQVQTTDSTWQQVTIKYRTDYFTVPEDTIPAPSSLLFYRNNGQIIDTEDSLRTDIFYYTINQYPKLFFQQDSVSFVMAHVDNDTATTDSLERIAMNFQDGDMHKEPYNDGRHDSDQVLNYFLVSAQTE